MNEVGYTVRDGARVMFYSHDTYGLGHLRRTLTLANHFRRTVPNLSQLIVSGSPSANRFQLPAGTDIVKLPAVTKNAAGAYEPRSLGGDFSMVRGMREDLILSAARHFQPDVFIVDHAPAGLRGEVVATLQHLRQACPDTRLVVGLRDIMDDPSTVRSQWARDGVYELFDTMYDLILVYGNRSFYDVVHEYGLSEVAARKTRFVGYLGRERGRRSPADVRASLNMQTDRLLLVTAGGGADGQQMYHAMLRDLDIEQAADMDVLIVGGPMLAEADRDAVQTRLGGRGNVHFLDFTDDLASYVGAADAVVTMGGYNTVCEVLSLGRPALIVPRVHPRQEQLIRARLLSERGMVHMLHPNDLQPSRLLGSARALLDQPVTPRPTFAMHGLDNVMRALDAHWPISGQAIA